MPPIWDIVKYLSHLFISTIFFLKIQSPQSLWSLSWLTDVLSSCEACSAMLGVYMDPSFNPIWSRHVTTAIWHARVTPEHKAHSSFLVHTGGEEGPPGLSPACGLQSLAPFHWAQPSSPISYLLSLLQASGSWLSSVNDIVHPSFLGSSVVSLVSHSRLELGIQLLLQVSPAETERGWKDPVSAWGKFIMWPR